MKTLTKGKMWCFAIGQFGWSLLSAMITNWLVYFYQPDTETIAAGQTLFIPQGRVILGDCYGHWRHCGAGAHF